MDRKYNSTTNPKYINNPIIYNLKSTSQRINTNKFSKVHNNKNSNENDQKSNGDFILENNSSQNDKSSKNNQNQLNDDTSLDNISNIISHKHNKLPDTHMLFEENDSSLNEKQNNTNPFQTKTKNKNNFKNLKSFSNINTFSNNNIEVCDSHIKSFQLQMKKMKEMNKSLLKENCSVKNSKTFNANNASNKDKVENNNMLNSFNTSKSIINFKQKIIYMKDKNKLLNKGNIYFNDTQNNDSNGSFNFNNFFNENSNKKIEEDKTIPFLCCFSKS
jgi:hypothetical protein